MSLLSGLRCGMGLRASALPNAPVQLLTRGIARMSPAAPASRQTVWHAQRAASVQPAFAQRSGSRIAQMANRKRGMSSWAQPKQQEGSDRTIAYMAWAGAFAALVAGAKYKQTLACEDLTSSRPYVNASSQGIEAGQAPPESIVNFRDLGFGTFCGICAGIFIKKGLKLIAFLLGGTYVLMQYFSSQRWISINWGAINSRYEKLVNTAAGGAGDPAGSKLTNSRLGRIWQRFLHFLTADFQQRATFTAGLFLGFRLG